MKSIQEVVYLKNTFLEYIREFNMENRLDDRIDRSIRDLLHSAQQYRYYASDLNKKVNADETLEEYIRCTEDTFGLEHADLLSMSSDALTGYVARLDALW